MPGTAPTLCLCMIVKNESYFLRRCLSQAAEFVDEIVIVDTGSTDDTRAIAAQYTDKVFDYAWRDDFAAARNFSLRKASTDWIIVLDADEVIAPDDWATIHGLMTDSSVDAYLLTQYNYSREPMDRNWLPVVERTPFSRDYAGYRPNPIGRLFRNRADIYYQGRVHEVIDRSVAGERYAPVDIPIHHHMDEDPSKLQVDRQLNYLRMIEQELDGETDGRLWLAAGTLCLYYTDDVARGIQYLERAAELGHKPDEALEYAAEGYYRLGDFDRAYAAYRRLYEGGHVTLNLCNNLANLAVKRAENEFAADLLERALSLGVSDYQVRLRLEHNIRYLRGQVS